ncbi:MAG TPA: alanine racemase [Actinomycetota bacterium]|nr:alanine racemase [Actinomycetota bacterium]
MTTRTGPRATRETRPATATTLTRAEIEARGHPVWAEIDLAALRHNVATLRALAPGAELMGVVKAYAYGHGNPQCAAAMLEAGATRIGVARVAEAIHLREAGVAAPIHVFTEPPPGAVATMVGLGLTPTVYTEPFAAALSDAARAAGRTIAVHVKLDTGMHRVGLPPDDVPDAIRALRRLPSIAIEGAWSHLAVADVPDHPFNRKQLELFCDLVEKIERAGVRLRYRHLANSAATMSLPETHFDLVRCGVASFGLWPGAALTDAADLRPVMSLRARVNMVKELAAGEALSYGLTHELRRRGRVVTVPAGYGDGYDRGLSGRADVLIGGRRHRVSGTVCMDQFMVDVGDDDVGIGALATLLGRDGDERVSAEELAAHAGTINYEITARLGSRVPRLFLDGDGA